MTKIISEMNEQEFKNAVDKIIEKMKEEYPYLIANDIRVARLFSMMFKEEYLN